MTDIPPTEFVKVSSASDPNSFKVLTYNTLAPCYTRACEFPYAPPAKLVFETRFPRIIKEIASSPADIICLQEVDHYETYRPELEKLGFSTEWKRKSAPACPDGPLVGYRKDRFQCLGKYEIEFDRVADSTQFDLKRGTVALALHLKCMKTGREVICANTHLFYHHSFNQIKYAQMAYLLSELAKIHKSLKDPEKIGVVICGDMNVWPDSNVIRLVYGLPPVETYPDISSEEHRQVLRYIWKTYGKPALEMASSYEGYMSALKGEPGTKKGGFEEVVKGHPPYTCITYTEYETLDYILYNKDALNVLSLLKVQEGVTVTPSDVYPSDHIRLISELAFVMK